MTPRSLDPVALQEKLRLLRDLLDDLERLWPVTEEDLESDSIRRYAVERILTQLVEMAVAVNTHIAGRRAEEGAT